jgi:hypothetical protein
MRLNDIQVGAWYQRVDDPDRLVKVTRTDGLVAYDIFGTDHRGHPSVSHSAMGHDRFAQLYQPRTL